MKFVRDTLFSAVDAAGNLTSSVIDSNQLISISLQAIATGTIAGTITLQFSNDSGFPQRPDPSSWSTVATVAVPAAGIVAIPKTELSYRWLRVIYTATSGAGNLTVNINALSI